MRALLQTQQRLLARGWNRPRARDYYDLWRILRDFGPLLEGVELGDLLRLFAMSRSDPRFIESFGFCCKKYFGHTL